MKRLTKEHILRITYFIIMMIIIFPGQRFVSEYREKEHYLIREGQNSVLNMAETLDNMDINLSYLLNVKDYDNHIIKKVDLIGLRNYATRTLFIGRYDRSIQWSDLYYKYSQFSEVIEIMSADNMLDNTEREYIQKVYDFNHKLLTFIQSNSSYQQIKEDKKDFKKQQLNRFYDEVEAYINSLQAEEEKINASLLAWNKQHYYSVEEAKKIADKNLELVFEKKPLFYDHQYVQAAEYNFETEGTSFDPLKTKPAYSEHESGYSVRMDMQNNKIYVRRSGYTIEGQPVKRDMRKKADEYAKRLNPQAEYYAMDTKKREESNSEDFSFYYIHFRDGIPDANSEIIVRGVNDIITEVEMNQTVVRGDSDSKPWRTPEEILQQLRNSPIDNKLYPIYDQHSNKVYLGYFDKEGQTYEASFDGVTGELIAYEKREKRAYLK